MRPIAQQIIETLIKEQDTELLSEVLDFHSLLNLLGGILMEKLILYYFEGCPFCDKVRKFLEGKSIDITYKNIHTDDEAYNTLIKIGGKSQVPCLFINDNPLYESEAIITWLKNNV